METIGAHQLIEVIGRGATGEVWRAIGPRPLARAVAIKRVGAQIAPERRAEVVAALRAEAEALAALDHPHIVRVHDVVADGDGVALVMDLARGGSLAELAAERGPLPTGAVVALVAPLADALDSAHRRGIVHGDVKPANVVLTSEGDPLLVDLGLARLMRSVEGAEGGLAGTDGFIDPDLLAGGERGPHNDVFALGALVRALTFGTSVGPDLGGEEDPLGPLSAIVAAACAPDPTARPRAGEVARRLRAAVAPDDAVLPGPVAGRALPAAGSDPGALPVGAVLAASVRRPGAPRRAPVGDAPSAPATPVTRTFGPRPPRPPAAPGWPRSRRSLVVAVGLAVVALVAVGAWRGGPEPSSAAHAATPPTGSSAPSHPPESRCDDVEPLPALAGARRAEADLRGDGCLVPVRWDGQVLEVAWEPGTAPRRYRIRSAGAVTGELLFGDWDCDGADSPALHHPASGFVSYFARLPERIGAPLAAVRREQAEPGGAARVVRGPGCDRVAVTSGPPSAPG